ncbi:alpha-L-fucosidase [Kribbella antibiotica]|uniref:alpha-L-fucosidase n=1 Tax=Kribbella antibiotica TaxID=190195 RepID=A0A4R4ZQA0_9ACTN|nr:alpha-L-fucosidase [Kribbella antibiotica]TDD59122.1 alpha-L-fucosidase [Kribbella antibiotica]
MPDGPPAASIERFRDWRFGLFVHWGLYALPARHEWVKNRERLTDEDYQPYFDHFEPDLYDPRKWARAAREAGMRYAVLTTKHHEGFCLWDSAVSDYTVAHTAWGAGKDLVQQFVEACREEGLGVGFYHSLIDWHHPEFPIDLMHPQRDDEEAIAKAAGRDVQVYADYLHAQTRELLTNYGQIDLMWFDFSYPGRNHEDGRDGHGKGRDDWRSAELMALVRELQPGILINDRLDIPGDFVTPEQYQPDGPMTRNGVPVLWEACQTLNGSWGYDRDNLDWKTPETLVKMLVDSVSKDGNLLLNVGPTGRGEFDPRALATLASIGEWTRLHERSFRGAGPAEFKAPTDTRYTQVGNRLYLHLFSWPMGHVHLPGLAGKVKYAQLLNDASEVKLLVHDSSAEAHNTSMGAAADGVLTLKLPIQKPNTLVPVIELFLS